MYNSHRTMFFSGQTQILLLSFIVLVIVESIGAFQSSSRAQWPSLVGREKYTYTPFIIMDIQIPSTRCAATRSRQSEEVEETSFLMKPFLTASGEIVYVFNSSCLLFLLVYSTVIRTSYFLKMKLTFHSTTTRALDIFSI